MRAICISMRVICIKDDLLASSLFRMNSLSMAGAPAQDRELRAQGLDTLHKLLDGGMRSFAERGFHATKVDDVVTAAGTSRATFYLYFANKEDLLRTLAKNVAQDAQSLLTSLPSITRDTESYHRLRIWLEQFTDFYFHYG